MKKRTTKRRARTYQEMRESCAKLGDMMAEAVGLPEARQSLAEALDLLAFATKWHDYEFVNEQDPQGWPARAIRFLRKHGRKPDPPTGGLIDLDLFRGRQP